jgi:hypothetical protein
LRKWGGKEITLAASMVGNGERLKIVRVAYCGLGRTYCILRTNHDNDDDGGVKRRDDLDVAKAVEVSHVARSAVVLGGCMLY